MEDDELNLEPFVLNDKKNRNSQVLFYETLKTLINKYNNLKKEN